MAADETYYQSYLLRLRRLDNDGQPVWRLSLERPADGEHWRFRSLDALVQFLTAQMDPDAGPSPGAEDGGLTP